MRPMRSPARTAKPVQHSAQFAATLLATLLLAGCGDDAQIGPGATTEVAAAQVRQPETAATQTATDGTAAQAATGDNATEAKDNATEAKKDTRRKPPPSASPISAPWPVARVSKSVPRCRWR